MFNEIWPLISVVLGIVILLVLIIGFKLNTFISLIITSMITALMLGIPLTKIMETIERRNGQYARPHCTDIRFRCHTWEIAC